MALALPLHVLAAVTWVGGMLFAYFVLRPAAESLAPPERVPLWLAVFRRFFVWVWAAVAVLAVSGGWMFFSRFGGFAGAGWALHVMNAAGLVMMALFTWVWFVPFRALQVAAAASDWPRAAAALGRIRRAVAVNLTLGVLVVAVAAAGRYL